MKNKDKPRELILTTLYNEDCYDLISMIKSEGYYLKEINVIETYSVMKEYIFKKIEKK